ncbi:MAG: hypothetical protein AMXMBFR82_11310 [Candidatus Hydrogenedentota bacterium]
MMRLRNAVPVALVTVLAWSGAFAQDDTPANTKPEPATVEHAPKPVPKEIAEKPLVPEPAESPDENPVFRVQSSMQVPEPGQEIDPEVAIAEAQVREAEARLRQARIAAAQREIEKGQLKRIVELARKNAKEEQRRTEAGIGTQQDLMEAQERLARAEADMAKLDAASQIMDGRGGRADSPLFQGRLFEQPRFPAPRPELSSDDKRDVAITLQAPVAIEFKDATLREVAEMVSEYAGVNIVLDVGLRAADEMVTIKLTNVPLEDGLLALTDAYGDLCFVIRDYGVFATTTERAMTINAPTIPANVPLLVPFQEASGRGFAVGMFGGGQADFGGGFGMGSSLGAAPGGFGGGGGVIAFPGAPEPSRGRSPGGLPEGRVAPGSSPDGGQPAEAGGQDNSPEE